MTSKQKSQVLELLKLTEPVIKKYGTSSTLREWKSLSDSLVGTEFPKCICPICFQEMSVNWEDGKPYDYCPEHGTPKNETLTSVDISKCVFPYDGKNLMTYEAYLKSQKDNKN